MGHENGPHKNHNKNKMSNSAKSKANYQHRLNVIQMERSWDSFEDEDLRDYPAKKIVETSFTIKEYETIVNKTLAKIASGQDKMHSAVKGLVRLAYNTLMDPAGPQPEELFFRKYKNFTESWQSILGRANNKEEPEEKRQHPYKNADYANMPRIELKAGKHEVPVAQRKAAIGVWAMCHLRAIIHPKEWLHVFFAKRDSPSEIIKEIYKFDNPYDFPSFDRDTYELMRINFSKRNPEVLYLLYRGAIILEHIFHRPELKRQKLLLLQVAYGNPNGLRGYGLELYGWFRSAAKGLHIAHEQLQSDLIWALNDGPYAERSRKSVETVLKLVDFYRIYHCGTVAQRDGTQIKSGPEAHGTGLTSRQASKYFLYARAIDGRFFSHLDADSNEELCSILVEICRMKGESHIPEGKVSSLWREVAQQLAEKICQRHAKQNDSALSNQILKENLGKQRESRPSKQGKDNVPRAAHLRSSSTQRPINQADRAGRSSGMVRNDRNALNNSNRHPNFKSDNYHQHQVRQNNRAASQVRNNHNHAVTSTAITHDGANRNPSKVNQVRSNDRAQSSSSFRPSIIAPHTSSEQRVHETPNNRPISHHIFRLPNSDLSHQMSGTTINGSGCDQIRAGERNPKETDRGDHHSGQAKSGDCSII